MKSIKLIVLISITILTSCSQQANTNYPKVDFAVYETINSNELQDTAKVRLENMGLVLDQDENTPIIGYINKGEFFNDELLQLENIIFSKTKYTVDKEGGLCAIVALKAASNLRNVDVKEAKAKENNVEIYFNNNGSKKWAAMTKNNIGKQLAFTIDGEVYSMPVIAMEIRNGAAAISGINQNEDAEAIAGGINASIK